MQIFTDPRKYGGKGHIEGLLRALSIVREASVVQWLCHSPCKPGVAGSIPGFSSLAVGGTLNPNQPTNLSCENANANLIGWRFRALVTCTHADIIAFLIG